MLRGKYDFDKGEYTYNALPEDETMSEMLKSSNEHVSLWYSTMPGIEGAIKRIKEKFIVFKQKMFSKFNKNKALRTVEACRTVDDIKFGPERCFRQIEGELKEEKFDEQSRIILEVLTEYGISVEPSSSNLKDLLAKVETEISGTEKELEQREEDSKTIRKFHQGKYVKYPEQDKGRQ